MSKAKELWDAAGELDGKFEVRSANAMRFYALAQMLAEAETSWLTRNTDQALLRLRELQAHCEKMVAELAPDKTLRPALIVTAA